MVFTNGFYQADNDPELYEPKVGEEETKTCYKMEENLLQRASTVPKNATLHVNQCVSTSET